MVAVALFVFVKTCNYAIVLLNIGSSWAKSVLYSVHNLWEAVRNNYVSVIWQFIQVAYYFSKHVVPYTSCCLLAGKPSTTKHATQTARLRNTPVACLSMDVRDCIRYKNTLKLFIHLRSSSKRVTARFATWNPANWHENQIEIRCKTLLIPQTLSTRPLKFNPFPSICPGVHNWTCTLWTSWLQLWNLATAVT